MYLIPQTLLLVERRGGRSLITPPSFTRSKAREPVLSNNYHIKSVKGFELLGTAVC
jgi:hypothetical protein